MEIATGVALETAITAGRRNRDDAKKNEDNFKCSVGMAEGNGPLANLWQFLPRGGGDAETRLLDEGLMTCVWKGDKLSADRDAERLSCAWKRVAFPT